LNKSVNSKLLITDLNWFSDVLNSIGTDQASCSELLKKQINRLKSLFTSKIPIWPKELLKKSLLSFTDEQKVIQMILFSVSYY
jgi:hypothetical protein